MDSTASKYVFLSQKRLKSLCRRTLILIYLRSTFQHFHIECYAAKYCELRPILFIDGSQLYYIYNEIIFVIHKQDSFRVTK